MRASQPVPMLIHTLRHLPFIDADEEERLWKAGVTSWDEAEASPEVSDEARAALSESRERLHSRDAVHFGSALPAWERWRLYCDFFDDCAFLDIETTGLGGDSYTTMAGVLDATGFTAYVRGENLDELPDALAQYRLVVTFNGLGFDVPFLRREFGNILPHAAHLDLMHVLRRAGFRGGLKRIERLLGVGRPGALSRLDGHDAVSLWHMAQEGEPDALDTLVRYNAEDVASLPKLAEIAISEHARGTPMAGVELPAGPGWDPDCLPYDSSLVFHLADMRGRVRI